MTTTFSAVVAVPDKLPVIEEENVLAPAIVCANVVIKPVEPDPAIGILNV